MAKFEPHPTYRLFADKTTFINLLKKRGIPIFGKDIKCSRWKSTDGWRYKLFNYPIYDFDAICSAIDEGAEVNYWFGVSIVPIYEMDGVITVGDAYHKCFNRNTKSIWETVQQAYEEVQNAITMQSGGLFLGAESVEIRCFPQMTKLHGGESFGNFCIKPVTKKNCLQWTLTFLHLMLMAHKEIIDFRKLLPTRNKKIVYPSHEDLCKSGYWIKVPSNYEAGREILLEMSKDFDVSFVIYKAVTSKLFVELETIGKTSRNFFIGFCKNESHIELINNFKVFQVQHINDRNQISYCPCKTPISRSKKGFCKHCISDLKHVKETDVILLQTLTKGKIPVPVPWKKGFNEPNYRFIGSLDIETREVDGKHEPIAICCIIRDMVDGELREFMLPVNRPMLTLDNMTHRWINEKLRHSEGPFEENPDGSCTSCHTEFATVMHHNHITGKNVGLVCKECNNKLKSKTAHLVRLYTWNGKKFDMPLIIRSILADEQVKALKPNSIITEGKGFKIFQIYKFILLDLKSMSAPSRVTLGDEFSKLTENPLEETFKENIGQVFYDWRSAFTKWDMKPFFDEDKTHWPCSNHPSLEPMRETIDFDKYSCNTISTGVNVAFTMNQTIVNLYCLVDCYMTLAIFLSKREEYRIATNGFMENFMTAPGMGKGYFQDIVEEDIIRLRAEKDTYWTYQSNIRGGIVQVNNRHCERAPEKKIIYIDANNLYGSAMLELMPCQTTNDIPDGEVTFEMVKVSWPDHLKNEKRWQALPPTLLRAKFDMSEMDLEKEKETNATGKPVRFVNTEKLAAVMKPIKALVDKRMSDYYREIGLEVEVISSCTVPGAYMFKKYVTVNHEERKKAKAEGKTGQEQTRKLFSNSLYGKMLEDTRKYKNINYCNNLATAMQKVSSKNNTKVFEIEEYDWTSAVALIYHEKPKTTKDPWIGLSILDISKLIMYRQLDACFKEDPECELLYMDTDSFILHVNCEFELPNEGTELGQFKDEYPEEEINEFICGGPKFYACFDKDGKRIVTRAKGNRIPEVTDIRNYYLDAVYGTRRNVPHFTKKMVNHAPKFVQCQKLFGSRYDVKRRWFDVNTSLPWQ